MLLRLLDLIADLSVVVSRRLCTDSPSWRRVMRVGLWATDAGTRAVDRRNRRLQIGWGGAIWRGEYPLALNTEIRLGVEGEWWHEVGRPVDLSDDEFSFVDGRSFPVDGPVRPSDDPFYDDELFAEALEATARLGADRLIPHVPETSALHAEMARIRQAEATQRMIDEAFEAAALNADTINARSFGMSVDEYRERRRLALDNDLPF